MFLSLVSMITLSALSSEDFIPIFAIKFFIVLGSIFGIIKTLIILLFLLINNFAENFIWWINMVKKTTIKTRSIKQITIFKASPEEVYKTLMDSKRHSAFSGGKAKMSRKVGGTFT